MVNHLLIQARKDAGLSQKQVAEKTGVTRCTINRWEQEKTYPFLRNREELCKLLQKTELELGLHPAPGEEGGSTFPDAFETFIPMLPETPLIGRDRELSELKSRLFSGNAVALNTLHGLPGVGKTALAVALAHDAEVRATFKDGILWAGLGPSPDIPAILHRWGTLLGIASDEMQQFNSHEAWALALRQAIGSRAILLVIDDVWTAEAIVKLKIGGHHCAYVVTTRFPAIARQSKAAMALQELPLEESLALLRELAPRLVEQEQEQASALARRVGGLPLALRLLGNYLRKHAASGNPRRIAAIFQQLRNAEVLLDLSEPQTPLARHPSLSGETPLSLQTILGVTFQALLEPEQAALCALSLFPPKPATFSETSALAVASCSEGALDALVDAGLLEMCDPDRYMLHQTIAEYAYVRLKEPIVQIVEARFIEHVLLYVEAHHTDYPALDQEQAIIFAALERVSRSARRESLLQMVLRLSPFLIEKGLCKNIEPYLHQAYDIARTQRHTGNEANLAHCLEQFAQVLLRRGEYAQAKKHLLEGLQLVRQSGQAEHVSLILKSLGAIEDLSGNYLQAKAYLLEGVAIARQLQRDELLIPNLINLGGLCLSLEEYPFAFQCLQEALERARHMGRSQWISMAINNLLLVATKLGFYALCNQLVEEGLALSQQMHSLEGMLLANAQHAFFQELRGEYCQASPYQGRALEIAQQIGDPYHRILTLMCMGGNVERQGQYEQAERYLQQALEIAQQNAGQETHLCRVYACLSDLAIKQGKYQQAVTYCQIGQRFAAYPQQDVNASKSLLLCYQVFGQILQTPTMTEEMHADLQQAQEWVAEQHHWETAIRVFGILGEMAALQGQFEQAVWYSKRALALAFRFHAKNEMSLLLALLGESALKQGNALLAEKYLHKGQKIGALQSNPEYQGRIQLALGELALQQRQLEAAHTAFQQSKAIIPAANPLLHARTRYGLARLAALQGRKKTARSQGEACLTTLEAIHHYQTNAVRTWLASLA